MKERTFRKLSLGDLRRIGLHPIPQRDVARWLTPLNASINRYRKEHPDLSRKECILDCIGNTLNNFHGHLPGGYKRWYHDENGLPLKPLHRTIDAIVKRQRFDPVEWFKLRNHPSIQPPGFSDQIHDAKLLPIFIAALPHVDWNWHELAG